eukprot:gene5530-6889_t
MKLSLDRVEVIDPSTTKRDITTSGTNNGEKPKNKVKSLLQKHDFKAFLSMGYPLFQSGQHQHSKTLLTTQVHQSELSLSATTTPPPTPPTPSVSKKGYALLSAVLNTSIVPEGEFEISSSISTSPKLQSHSLLNPYYIKELTDRKENIEKDVIFKSTDFKDYATFQLWKKNQLIVLNNQLSNSHKLPAFNSKTIVKVLRGKDFRVKDQATKSSDPFTCLTLLSLEEELGHKRAQQSQKTSTKKLSLNPEWNEWFCLSTEKKEEHVLIASVYDEDLVTKHDFMGRVTINLNELGKVLPLNPLIKTYPLEPKPEKKSILDSVFHHHQNDKVDKGSLGTLDLSLYHIKRDINHDIKHLDGNNDNFTKHFENDHVRSMKEIVDLFIKSSDECSFPSPLEKFLKNYESRIGISPCIRILFHLEKLLSDFSINEKILNQILSLVKQLINGIESKTFILSNELENRLQIVMKSVKTKFAVLLKRYGLSFPVSIDEKSGVVLGIGDNNGTLLTLTIEIFKLSNFYHELHQVNQETIDKKLEKYVNEYFEFFYQIIKEKSEIAIEDSKEFENIVGLLDIYDALEIQITNDIDIYSSFFPKTMDVGLKSSLYFYKRIKEDTEKILSKENKVSMEVFILLKKIQSLDNLLSTTYEKEIESIRIDLKQFDRFISMWTIEARKQFTTWIDRCMEKETWKSINTKSKILHSDSVVDLFSIFEIGKNHILGLQVEISDKLMEDFIKMISEMYTNYLNLIMNSILVELDDRNDPIFIDEVNESSKSSFIKFVDSIFSSSNKNDGSPRNSNLCCKTITSTICVKLNCIEYSRQLLDEFSSDLESKLLGKSDLIRDTFTKAFAHSKERYEYLIDLVITKISKWIKVSLNIIFSKPLTNIPTPTGGDDPLKWKPILIQEEKVTEFLEPLTKFLNNELSILSSNLYHPTFFKFLKGVWMSIWKECDRMMFPDTMGAVLQITDLQQQFKKSCVILSIYHQLELFFNAENDGVSIEQLQSLSEYLFQSLTVFFTPTKQLIQTHQSLLSSLNYQPQKDSSGANPAPAPPLPTFSQLIKIAPEFNLPKYTQGYQVKEIHIVSALSPRQKLESDAKQFIKSVKETIEFRFISERFNLPIEIQKSPSNILKSFQCKVSFGIPTYFYLLETCICWCSYLSYNDSKTWVQYSEITNITKGLLSGQDSFHLVVNEKIYDIWSFTNVKRDDIFKLIFQQISKYNKKLNLSFINTPNEEPEPVSPKINPQQQKQLQERQKEVIQLFNLDLNEEVYESLSCFKHGIVGRITLTNNYFCYQNLITHSTQKSNWDDLLDITKSLGLFFTPSGIKINFKSYGKIKLYSGFQDRDKAYNRLVEIREAYLNKINKKK